MEGSFYFTSESVSEGHPDKLCDRVSDSILDSFLSVEESARVACETFATTNRLVVGGEVGVSDEIKLEKLMSSIEGIARMCVKDIGYAQAGFHWQKLTFDNLLHKQSVDIAQGVDRDGAGDQGIMFGYAVNENDKFMPAALHYSHAILKRLSEVRKNGSEPQLGPDSKSQLTLKYENGKPVSARSIVLSTQHLDEKLSSQDVRNIVEPYIREILPEEWIGQETEWHINPTGKFVIGGPDGDAGLTGRKIIVDTYGGAAPHGGGAFSGKDPTKVDRSAAYAARYLAKNVVAAGLAEKCCIQLSYAIGIDRPLSIFAETYGTGTVSRDIVERAISKSMDLSPKGIIDHLRLRRPIYSRTAAYGHFGRDPESDGGFSWEKLDLIDEIKSNSR
ncbi:MAG: methionine adenosyltransferase [Paracoccaceae bacterium]